MKEEIKLTLATVADAELIHQMKYEAFLPLYEKYHDDETSPVKESIDNVIWKLSNPNSEYYLIQVDGKNVGAIRIYRKCAKGEEGEALVQNINYISPIFILPEFQNKGIAQLAIQKVFELYEDTIIWRLDTIKQEKGNCHLYEKCGFVRVGEEHIVNELMTLIDYEKSVKSDDNVLL
ncbi:MAG: GNAT family N-acetyltransferase [Lachnospiraceae bacterium]|nr:GNAT family N-acetyltransferase [Lachnospiraceae bacterium]